MSKLIPCFGIRNRKKIVVAHAIVDDEDFEKLSQFRWFTVHGYAMATDLEKKKNIQMHRIVLGIENVSWLELYTDHINRNRLDNRRMNLRTCKPFQNQGNRRMQPNNTSGFIGVVYDPSQYSRRGIRYEKVRNLPWKAHIKKFGKVVNVGRFKTKEEAARAYNEAAKKHFGEFATLNKL